MSLYTDYRNYWYDNYNACYGEESVSHQKRIGKYYYKLLKNVLVDLVEENNDVLCVRSDIGQYLDWVKPSYGVGIEKSEKLLEISRNIYPKYNFYLENFEEFNFDHKFDYVLLINAINDIFDIDQCFQSCVLHCNKNTKLIINFYNYAWQPIVILWEFLGLKRKQIPQNWFNINELTNIVELNNLKIVRIYKNVLFPYHIPLFSFLLNSVISRLPWIDNLCLNRTLVLRNRSIPCNSKPSNSKPRSSISVVIPCKNEAGNIEEAVKRIPELEGNVEIIFCNDKSTDNTKSEILKVINSFPDKNIKLVEGPGICKAENVWKGFDSATCDIILILDGDLAVPPEEIEKFYNALDSGQGEFINGTRMVYPLRKDSMRLLNFFGNIVFAAVFSFILRQKISDTLCGTKALWRKDYLKMKKYIGTWGIKDRWGDYELLFGAARLNLDILEIPVHYMERIYGTTKMKNRLANAWRMFRICMTAFLRFRGI